MAATATLSRNGTNGNGAKPQRTVRKRASKPATYELTGNETVKIEMVSPTKADKWLEGNVRNRALRESRVNNLVGSLARGEWKLTGDCVVFDTEGTLINGQHRLTSISESGVTAPLVVLRGVEPEAQEVMDAGLKRSLADALKLRGEKYTFALAAAINWTYRLEYMKATGNVHYGNPADRPTTPQALHVLDVNPELRDYTKYSQTVVHTLKLRHGLTACLYYHFALIDAGEADGFFEALESGTDLKKDNPIWHLRKGLIADAAAISRMPDYRQAAIICKAWNAWREGKPVQQLAWKYTATTKEAFPFPQ